MTTVDEAWVRWSELMDSQLTGAAKGAELPESFRLITHGGDRHGALEWTYYSQSTSDDTMDRLISIAVIPHVQWEFGTFEFWFGGRREDRYTRRLASSLEVSLKEPDWQAITAALDDAVDQALSVAETHLNTVLPAAPF
ncbi:hypothetical protein GXW82_23290 [Streptacidiphilus sp. 4-A2]|nr:hypothetical protein [Streptacidiphilus sp. 4-A2]